jgi:hypothetical protein
MAVTICIRLLVPQAMLVLSSVFLAAHLLKAAAAQQPLHDSPTSYASKISVYDSISISSIEDLGDLSAAVPCLSIHPTHTTTLVSGGPLAVFATTLAGLLLDSHPLFLSPDVA